MSCKGARYISVEGLPTCGEEILHNTPVSCQFEFDLRLRSVPGKGLSTEPCEWGRLWLREVVLFLHSSANQTNCFYSQIRLPYTKTILLPSTFFLISKTRKIKLSLCALWSHTGGGGIVVTSHFLDFGKRCSWLVRFRNWPFAHSEQTIPRCPLSTRPGGPHIQSRCL
jgi:hypothetical protein